MATKARGPGNPRFTGANTFVPQIRGGYHLVLHEGQIAEMSRLITMPHSVARTAARYPAATLPWLLAAFTVHCFSRPGIIACVIISVKIQYYLILDHEPQGVFARR